MSKFAIASFAYSERYQKQINRMISEIDSCNFKPTVVVVTDNVDNILDKPFVKKYDISQFNPEYKNYSNSYYTFDFSVKRYSLLAALNLGYTKIILSDADAVPNKQLFNEEQILKGFVSNSIQGQVTYNFSDQIMTNSELGKRFLEYEKFFNVSFDKNQLNFMPEDCIQFLDIEVPKFYNFLRVWDECIHYKNKNGLRNTPAGNIDEMCFAALKCGLTVGNNSGRLMNALIPIHDKWYDSSFNTTTVIESKNINKKTILTSVYDLNYIDDRGSGIYKGFHLLTQTIRNIIFDDYDYIIYTNKETYDRHNLSQVFPQQNVTIKFKELNSEYYTNYLNPIRERRVKEGEIWDRIHSVKNYIEVILNKIELIVEESKLTSGEIIWMDSGLFGTSCSNAWRDYMNEICHTKNFVDKIFEKISIHKFIALLGNHILINYEIREKINNSFGTSLKVVPGCLFGGKTDLVIEYLEGYKEDVEKCVNILSDYLSEQEILFLRLKDKNIKFFEFDDWNDLQKAFLKIMDLYDETTYQTETLTMTEDFSYDDKIKFSDAEIEIEDIIEYPLSDREILEQILKVSKNKLNNIDMTKNDYMIKNMSVFALYYDYPAGSEHYRLLSYISSLYRNETLLDIGTNNGCSAIALSDETSNLIESYDIVKIPESDLVVKENIKLYIKNIIEVSDKLKSSRFILLDTSHDGIFENIFYKKLKEINYKGLLLLDDINLNQEMKSFWSSISEEKYNLTIKGHNTGTGLVLFE